jgi:LmbE family N-acetylglucosaminyl deacetylase
MRTCNIPWHARKPKYSRATVAWLRLAAVCVGLALLVGSAHAAASLASASRILVIAPHPDDETLGAGGLIYSACRRGANVKTVFMTMGDGSAVAAGMLFGTARPSLHDMVALGLRRRNEAVAALGVLGVDEDDIVFLGYPDGGLADIIDNRHWGPAKPYTSKHTGHAGNPYVSSFTPDAQYCASRIVDDLATILAEYMPDMVLVPHPNDTHSDHWATYALTMYTIEQLSYVELTGASVLAYMLHTGPDWPQPWGYRPDLPLDPPRGRDSPPTAWISAELTEDAIAAKLKALEKYRSQLSGLSAFLKSFIRTNESFCSVPVLDLAPPQVFGRTHKNDAPSTRPDPSPFRVLPPSGEIRSVVANRTDDGVAVTAVLAWRPSPSVTYRLQIVSCDPAPELSGLLYGQRLRPTAKELTYETTPSSGQRRPWEAVFLIPQHDLESLGPKALIEVVTIRRGLVLDRSGWILLRLCQ